MLNVGATAPDFTLRDQNQQLVTLRGYRGAKNVLLVFFPLAFTGICQGELDQLRDHLPEFENDDSAALAISVGPPPTTRSGRRRADSRFRCCRTSGHTARSVRPTASSTSRPASLTGAPLWSIGQGSFGSPR